MPTSQKIGEELHQLRTEQDALFASKKNADGALEMSAEEIGAVRKRNDDITAKAKEYEAQLEVEQIATGNSAELKRLGQPIRLTSPEQPQGLVDADGSAPSAKTLGELFVESEAFKSFIEAGKPRDGGMATELNLEKLYGKAAAALGVKALFDTATGYAPQAVRLPEVVTPGAEQFSVASLMPEGRTSQNAVPYMEETTTTNAAAEVAEGLAKPESALALTEKSSPVRKIATHLPVTDESFDDVPMLESYINSRLRLFVLLRENQQLLSGSGTAPNLRGILNVSGIQTQALGVDPVPDAVYKAMTKVRVGAFLEPTAAVFHPNDWQDIRLLRTTDGIYIWGSPAEAGPERIWGLDVRQTTQMTENTGLVGAFRSAAQIFRRSELSMQVGYINDQFIKNQRTILVEERLALVVFRPAGFCTVTGI